MEDSLYNYELKEEEASTGYRQMAAIGDTDAPSMCIQHESYFGIWRELNLQGNFSILFMGTKD